MFPRPARRFQALLLLLALWSAPAAPRAEEAAPELKPLFYGAARLFSLGRVTVVYPSRPGERLELARESALQRADYLRVAHGLDADVAADDAISESQLRGHLLVLGWENRLLGTNEAPRPFGTDPRQRRVFDLPIDPQDDLLFAWSSPYAPESRLIFWSRMDPELDRFSVLPFSGSDWTVFRDYRVTHQGMFDDSSPGWPPRRNLEAEADFLALHPDNWLQQFSEHFVLHWLDSSLEPGDAERILTARESALREISARLGAPPPGYRIDLFVYKDAEEKLRLSSVPDLLHHVGPRQELHMTRRTALSSSPHEDIHLLARALWGPCYASTICEGVAVAFQDAGPEPLAMFAALMLEHGELPAISELLDEESYRKLVKRRLGFPASGLFIAWLSSEKGPAGLQQVYGLRRPTLSQLSHIVGKSPRKLQRSFEKWVHRQAEQVAGEVAFRTAVDRARVLKEQNDLEGAARSLAEALALRADDCLTRYKLALVQLEAGDLAAAEASLEHLIELAREQEQPRFVVFGHYQLGRLRDLQGRREDALRQFERVLALPDLDGSHAMAQTAIEAPETELP